MSNFCSCGSLIINENCTNKNCAFKSTTKGSATKRAPKSANKELKKPARAKKSSKCITYNLNDSKPSEDVT